MALALRRLRKKITSELVRSYFDEKRFRFLPESSFSLLITEPNIREIFPGSSDPLVQFVCYQSKRIFLTLVWTCDGVQDLLSVIERFQEFGLTDKHLPIENLAINGKCKAKPLWESSANSQEEEAPNCTHETILNVFHYPPWESCTIERFNENQWKFLSPVFKKTGFKQELDKCVILPFTWVSERGQWKEGHFSIVCEAKLRTDHQDEFQPVRCRVNL
jgi:hypothetical protein